MTSILSPFGVPISERPPIPDAAERQSQRDKKRLTKLERRLLVKGWLGAKERYEELERLRAKGVEVDEEKLQKASRRSDQGNEVTGIEESLPSGDHRLSSLQERAQRNRRKESRWAKQAADNREQADRVGEEVGVGETDADVQRRVKVKNDV